MSSIPVESDEPSNSVRQSTFFNTIDKNANEIEVLQKSGINYATESIVQTVTNGDTTHSPSGDAVYDFTNAIIVQTVTNGDTTHSPSADAVFDHVAAADAALLATSVTDGDTTHAPTGNAVFDHVAGKILTATAVLDFPNILANTTTALTMTVTGAAVGDAVAIGSPEPLTGGLMVMGRISAANTVSVRVANVTTGAIDPASATYRATVFKA